MRRNGGQAWLSCALLLLTAAAAAAASAQAQEPPLPGVFDTLRSELGFVIRTRFGQPLSGDFPEYEGWVEYLPDGRHRVLLRIATTAARLPGRPRYTSWMRGSSFFDADRHPWMEFASEPYAPALLRDGGGLDGLLTLRGVSHREQLQVAPAACGRPGYDCDIRVTGAIERSRYGMRDWQVALSDEVLLTGRLRLREAKP